ncbi:hypothetical protein JTE90_001480 [Oedothorax gibbosus]|uniref:SMP-30/Gluconolactonase/LRE-like region domain-containing protein n=1 Tax=Oedothorax gibbosus TaxID=931172 RepID=A0AAV6TCY1_9ARAC|nr:hypothetical protein JTE90_001480 [Oedothorax gibbosus]
MNVTAVLKKNLDLGEGPHGGPIDSEVDYVDAFVGEWYYNVCDPVPNCPFKAFNNIDEKIRKLDFNTGGIRSLTELTPADGKDRFNDGKCDNRGRLWTGTLVPSEEEKEDGTASNQQLLVNYSERDEFKDLGFPRWNDNRYRREIMGSLLWRILSSSFGPRNKNILHKGFTSHARMLPPAVLVVLIWIFCMLLLQKEKMPEDEKDSETPLLEQCFL